MQAPCDSWHLSVTNVVHVASKISDSAHLADASSHLVDRLVVSLEFGCELAALLLQAPHALLGNDIRAAKLGPLIRKLEHALQGALVPLALLRDLLVDRSALRQTTAFASTHMRSPHLEFAH
eukprot:734332-Pleurochrysis_carterae.AAC.1